MNYLVRVGQSRPCIHLFHNSMQICIILLKNAMQALNRMMSCCQYSSFFFQHTKCFFRLFMLHSCIFIVYLSLPLFVWFYLVIDYCFFQLTILPFLTTLDYYPLKSLFLLCTLVSSLYGCNIPLVHQADSRYLDFEVWFN